MAHEKGQHIRKLTKVGAYSYALVIPKELIEGLHWRERQKLTVEKYGKGLRVKDWKKKKKT